MRKLLTFISGGILMIALFFAFTLSTPAQAEELPKQYRLKKCWFSIRTKCSLSGFYCNYRTHCDGTPKL